MGLYCLGQKVFLPVMMYTILIRYKIMHKKIVSSQKGKIPSAQVDSEPKTYRRKILGRMAASAPA